MISTKQWVEFCPPSLPKIPRGSPNTFHMPVIKQIIITWIRGIKWKYSSWYDYQSKDRYCGKAIKTLNYGSFWLWIEVCFVQGFTHSIGEQEKFILGREVYMSNPLHHLYISMHIHHTVLCTFPKALTMRTFLTITSIFNWQ